MKVDLVVVLLAHVSRVEAIVLQRIAFHESGSDRLLDFSIELFQAAYALLLLAVFSTPDRKRSSPETASGEVPVLDILKPLTETSSTGRFRFPSDGLVQCHHLVLDCRGLDEPCVERIVKHRLVCSPAVRIAVDVLLNLECTAVHLHHHAEVHVKCRRISRKGVIEGILHIASRIFLVFRRYIGGNIFRIKVFQREKSSVVIDQRLMVSILVNDHHRTDSGSRSHLLVVRTERRGNMYDTCSPLISRYIVTCDYAESVSVDRFEPWNELMVSDAGEFRTLESTIKHLERNELVARFVIFQCQSGSLRAEPL